MGCSQHWLLLVTFERAWGAGEVLSNWRKENLVPELALLCAEVGLGPPEVSSNLNHPVIT